MISEADDEETNFYLDVLSSVWLFVDKETEDADGSFVPFIGTINGDTLTIDSIPLHL